VTNRAVCSPAARVESALWKTLVIPTYEARQILSPFRRLLLTDVYDGPKAGIAIDAEGRMYPFQLLDWDDQQRVRVFRVGLARGSNWRDVKPAFRSAEPTEWTEWVLPLSLPPLAEQVLREIDAQSRAIAVVAACDLLGTIDVWRPTSEIRNTQPATGWLEQLGLPRRGRTP
jgi:hypothetical protein